ncbi:DNA internalization-related competence protein ComEC/Rec2 [Leminorella grimontii]|uniref:DNA internalization-related competence protein ComEC/Rec2 n=1 Tax=Leminorella grimontii TaxID=82981 RepID=UPI0021C34675|nr:DNA internalization-related competence protein ComEC/Rec2 [Leminorella grimontii]
MFLLLRLSFDAIAIAAIIGILPLLFLVELPSSSLWYLVACGTCCLALVRNGFCRWVSVALVFFLWGTLLAGRLCDRVDFYSGKSAVVEGKVVSANLHSGNPYVSRRFDVTHVDGLALSTEGGFPLSLAFPAGKESVSRQMQSGQRWRLSVNFRPVHGRLNEGGYDKQRSAMSNGQPLIGRIKSAELLDGEPGLRQRLVNRSLEITSGLKYQGVLMALAFGERERVSQEDNQRFIKTGTAHLMAISGLHIVFAGGFGFALSRMVQRFLPNRLVGPRFPLLAGWLAAALYVWLAGANPPALRTLCAITAYLGLRLAGIHWSSWQVWIRIVALLLVIDPMMALSDSFWLSCLAVAGLIFWFQWLPLPESGRWLRPMIGWLSAQFAMMALLLPLQFLLFHGLSLSSLLGNAVAIPIVSWVAVPFILCGLVTMGLPDVSYAFWWVADGALSLMMTALSNLEFGWINVSIYGVALSFAGWIAVVVWRFGLWRSCPFSCGAILLLLSQPCWQREDERWRVDMLDVGHGLAVIIRQGNEAVIYDTGQSWGDTSAAEREIIPFLRWHGLNLTGIILSHQHSDHIGGLNVLRKAYPDAWLKSSVSGLGQPCRRAERWQWKTLTFDALWPERLTESAGNPESCVIQISDGRFRLLLTGDLEQGQERRLVAHYGDELASTLLQVPHHGSRTSSTKAFIDAVNPQAALASAARFNPWRLPAENTIIRYRQAEIDWYSTSEEGQVSALFYNDNYHVLTLRAQIMPRWYHASFGSLRHNE